MTHAEHRGSARENAEIQCISETNEMQKEGKEEVEERKKRKRGRRAGKKINKKRKTDDQEETKRTERKMIRNPVGRTKYMQVIRGEIGVKRKWTEEEEEKEWAVKEIVQEIELRDESIQYRVQFVGFKKLSDAR